ncbi:MAG: hypothetical protein M1831_007434 [Alyxoria varia]|nr:MAG: hypothetical protein M1831_007434 [Alyxoria varia]
MPAMNNLQKAMQALGVSEDPSVPLQPGAMLFTPQEHGIGHPPYPCPEADCVECFQQWRRPLEEHELHQLYVNILTDDQASRLLTLYVASIKGNQKWLRETLAAQGDLIIARWIRGKRASYIDRAFPKLYPKAFPEQVMGFSLIDWRVARKSFREAYLLPYFNKEMLLLDQLNLLRLLHVRCQHDFHKFVMLDKQQLQTGFKSGALPLDFNKHCVDMTPTDRYGKLTPFNQDKAHKWIIIGFPRAKVVIEAQAKLYANLRRIVEVILNETTNVHPNVGQWARFTSSSCRLEATQESRAEYPHRAFAGPPMVDMIRFCELARTRRTEAEDHLWLLQTEPGYIQSAIGVFKSSVIFKKAEKHRINRFAVAELVNLSRKRLRMWKNVETECQNLCNACQYIPEPERAGFDLPADYERALNLLELMLINCLLDLVRDLKTRLPISPGFQENYNFHHFANGKHGSTLKDISSKERDVNVAYFEDDPLQWCLLQLSGDPENYNSTDHALLFSFLETHLDKSEKQRQRVDQKLYNHLSDMAGIHELLSTLRLQQPLHAANRFTFNDVNDDDRKRSFFWRIQEKKPQELGDAQLDELGASLQEFESARLPFGRENKAYFARAVAAREQLIAFWKKAREIVQEQYEEAGMNQVDCKDEVNMLSYAFASDNERQLEYEQGRLRDLQEHEASKKKRSVPKEQPKAEEPLMQHTVQDQPHPKADFLLFQRPKEKVKTRPTHASGVAEASNVVSAADDASAETQLMAESIKVRSSSINLFSKMFPKRGKGDDTTGKIRWADFVGAMADAGFIARKGSGSAVLFENDKQGHEGKIVVHRPHPDPEVSHPMLKCIGKRMRKWFGWGSELFVEAKIEAKGG